MLCWINCLNISVNSHYLSKTILELYLYVLKQNDIFKCIYWWFYSLIAYNKGENVFGYRFILITCHISFIWPLNIKILLICSQPLCLLHLQNFIQIWLSVVHTQARLCCGITVAIKELPCRGLRCQLQHTQWVKRLFPLGLLHH